MLALSAAYEDPAWAEASVQALEASGGEGEGGRAALRSLYARLMVDASEDKVKEQVRRLAARLEVTSASSAAEVLALRLYRDYPTDGARYIRTQSTFHAVPIHRHSCFLRSCCALLKYWT